MILLYSMGCVVDAAGITGKLLLPGNKFFLPFLTGKFHRQFSSAMQGWCLPQMFSGFSSCPTLPVYAHSPVQTPSLLSSHLFFVSHSEVLSLCLSTTQSPCFHHSGPAKSPNFFLHLLVSGSAVSPCSIPASLSSPASLFSLSSDNPRCLLSAHILKHRHISHRWK